jgi:C4-dicarboxylate-specific signal transduction histidine kinase
MRGENGYQFAVGKVSHQPGLYLSAPIVSGKKIIGVVVVKIEISRLARNIDFSNAFLVDENGVIILSQDSNLIMKAIPGNAINDMSYERRLSIYARDQFEAITMQPWPNYPRLTRIGNFSEPFAISITAINNGELKLYILSPASQVLQLNHEFLRLVLLITGCGAGGLIIVAGILLYIHTRHLINHLLHMQHEELSAATGKDRQLELQLRERAFALFQRADHEFFHDG